MSNSWMSVRILLRVIIQERIEATVNKLVALTNSSRWRLLLPQTLDRVSIHLSREDLSVGKIEQWFPPSRPFTICRSGIRRIGFNPRGRLTLHKSLMVRGKSKLVIRAKRTGARILNTGKLMIGEANPAYPTRPALLTRRSINRLYNTGRKMAADSRRFHHFTTRSLDKWRTQFPRNEARLVLLLIHPRPAIRIDIRKLALSDFSRPGI